MTTYGTVKAEIEYELNIDVSNADVVTDTELISACNRYIKESALQVYPLIQDYYLTEDLVSLVASTSDYAYPTQIYANKIRWIQFDDGSVDYMVKILKKELIPSVQAGDDFTWRHLNTAAAGAKMRFYPTPVANDSTSMTRHFIRTPNLVTGDASVIDLPDTCLAQHMLKVYVMKKMGHPLTEYEIGQTKYYQTLYQGNLATMIPDEDDTMDEDYTHYEEHE